MKSLWVALLLSSSLASAKMLCLPTEPEADRLFACREARVILRPNTNSVEVEILDREIGQLVSDWGLDKRGVYWARNYHASDKIYELTMMTNQVVAFHKRVPEIEKQLRTKLGFEGYLKFFTPFFFLSRAGHVWDENNPYSTRIFFLQDIGVKTKLQTHALLKQMIVLKRNLDKSPNQWKALLEEEFPNANIDWNAFASCTAPTCWSRLSHSISWASEYHLAGPELPSTIVEEITSEVKKASNAERIYAH